MLNTREGKLLAVEVRAIPRFSDSVAAAAVVVVTVVVGVVAVTSLLLLFGNAPVVARCPESPNTPLLSIPSTFHARPVPPSLPARPVPPGGLRCSAAGCCRLSRRETAGRAWGTAPVDMFAGETRSLAGGVTLCCVRSSFFFSCLSADPLKCRAFCCPKFLRVAVPGTGTPSCPHACTYTRASLCCSAAKIASRERICYRWALVAQAIQQPLRSHASRHASTPTKRLFQTRLVVWSMYATATRTSYSCSHV